MSAAITSSARLDASVPAGAIVRRFAWKEFRMLRGLWLAVAILGAITQGAINMLSPPSLDHASLLFTTALAATVLFAVGASATTFSVEHEEETFDFLAALPMTWWPVYVGKLIAVVASAVALAGSLSVIGWMVCRFEAPSGHNATIALGLFGVAILEGTAWGMLFSLLMTRPLVAAILTLVTGTIGVNLAVYLSSSKYMANLKPSAYFEALPLRLAIVILVLAASAVVARRWLTVGTAAGPATQGQSLAWRVRFWQRLPRWRRHTRNAQRSRTRRQMLARLLWQTWRDGAKLFMLPIGIAALLFVGIAAVIVLAGPRAESKTAAMAATILFIPALYGAMAFAADQRRGSYRFLAEHAAHPRYVWLARHVVWLGTLMVLPLAIFLAYVVLAGLAFSFAERLATDYARGTNIQGHESARAMTNFVDGAILIGLGTLTAYGFGQLCSMLMRSAVLSAFVALVMSVLITAWGFVLFAWQLNGWLFLLPVAAALMLATWLRAPDWIAGRNSWRAWLKPVLVVLTTSCFVGLALPYARLAQIPDRPKIKRFFGGSWGEASSLATEEELQTVDQSLADMRRAAGLPEARETAEMYRRAVELLHSWEDNNPLAMWEKPEFALTSSDGRVTAIDESKIPYDQREAFLKAKQRHVELKRDAQAAAAKLAIETSARSTCHFDFDFNPAVIFPTTYHRLDELLDILWKSEPNPRFERLLAALRMSAHLRMNQPSIVFVNQLLKEQAIHEQVGSWAAHDGRTQEELHEAIKQLTAHYRLLPQIGAALIADHGLVEEVVLGRTGPWVLARDPDSPLVYLAYLANQLPWERARALKALKVITLQNVHDSHDLMGHLGYLTNNSHDLGITFVRRWLRPTYGPNWTDRWVLAQPAAATSYLARLEYEGRVSMYSINRVYCDNQVFRRAALLQIALAAYRRDHNAYPTWLNELVPDYLDRLPTEPYSGQPFGYQASGLDFPLIGGAGSWNFKRIEANTPVFWSVGAGNARLKLGEHVEVKVDEHGTDVRGFHITVYLLASEEQLWWGEPAFAFPLPK